MAKYLDPKADLTFKKVFGEHPNLVASLLNSLLPLPEGEEIADIEYMSPERVPRTSIGKNSIVDVFCRTKDGRQFIVEMQMCWTADFKDRALFNSAKVYVDQLEHAEDFSMLRPVYSLNLVDDVFEADVSEFIHHYKVVHEKYTDKLIEGFHIVFVELPKFKPQSIAERKMAVLWLKFLTEVGNKDNDYPPELLENEDTRQAMEIVEAAGYNRAQLMGYDLFWDRVRVERSIHGEAERVRKAAQEQLAAIAAERDAATAERDAATAERDAATAERDAAMEKLRQDKLQAARNLKAMKLTNEQIAAAIGLSAAEIEKLQ